MGVIGPGFLSQVPTLSVKPWTSQETVRWLGCVSMRTAAAALRQGTAEEESKLI